LEDLIHEHPENFTYLAGLSATLNDLGLVWYGRGDFRKAQCVFEAAIEYLTPVFEQSPHATRYRHLISIHYFNIGRYAYLPLDEPIKAADAARKARRLNPEDGHNLWRAARVLMIRPLSNLAAAVPARRLIRWRTRGSSATTWYHCCSIPTSNRLRTDRSSKN
jgi:tetratricopeptide (TPR) repeat protein